MVEFLKTLAIACIPAIITGIVTYIVARKNAASQISIIKEQNKHDLEKLIIRQHCRGLPIGFHFISDTPDGHRLHAP